MNDTIDIKTVVKEKYGKIALKVYEGQQPTSCCGPSGDNVFSIMSDDYTKLDGYVSDADLGLGCGIPTEFAMIKEGDTVLDLGSGAGNDVFVARRLVGSSGRVIGLDMTEEMIQKANENNRKLGFENVSFVHGDIENMPIESGSVDVVISNCVLNLVPDKAKAYGEIYRVLKKGGHFTISDVVIEGKLPVAFTKTVEMYVGCVAGALEKNKYLNIIEDSRFSRIEVKKLKEIIIPETFLNNYFNSNEVEEYKKSGCKILSATIVGWKE